MLRTISNWIGRLGVAGIIAIAAMDGADGAEPNDGDDVAAERLEFMLGTVKDFEVVPDEKPNDRWPLYPKPILRWSNPVAGIRDGIVVMWTDGARPAILAQVFPTKDNVWIHEFQSLAASPFVVRDDQRLVWEPRQAGSTFQSLDDAPPPAETPAKRLVQMRALARQFTAFDDFRIHFSDKEATRHELRLMASPVYRYQQPERQILDGGVFPFVLGTDPEVFLVFEARKSGDGTRSWAYLAAPMTCWGLEVKYKDRTVWTMAERFGKHSARDPYHVWLPPVKFNR